MLLKSVVQPDVMVAYDESEDDYILTFQEDANTIRAMRIEVKEVK